MINPVPMSIPPILIILASLLVLAACGDSGNVHAKEAMDALKAAGQDLQRATQALKEFAYAKRDELKTEMGGRIEKLEQDLQTYRDRAAELAKAGKAKAAERVTQLRQQLDVAKQRLRELGESSGEAWTKARDGTVEAWRVLRQSLDEAMQEIK